MTTLLNHKLNSVLPDLYLGCMHILENFRLWRITIFTKPFVGDNRLTELEVILLTAIAKDWQANSFWNNLTTKLEPFYYEFIGSPNSLKRSIWYAYQQVVWDAQKKNMYPSKTFRETLISIMEKVNKIDPVINVNQDMSPHIVTVLELTLDRFY